MPVKGKVKEKVMDIKARVGIRKADYDENKDEAKVDTRYAQNRVPPR